MPIIRREESSFDARGAEVDTKESMHIGFPLHKFFATCNNVLDVGFVQAQHFIGPKAQMLTLFFTRVLSNVRSFAF